MSCAVVFSLPLWAERLAAVAAILTAIGIIWQKGVRPTYRVTTKLFRDIDRIADATPILVEIAEEFRPNGGATLRDTVDRIEKDLCEVKSEISTIRANQRREDGPASE